MRHMDYFNSILLIDSTTKALIRNSGVMVKQFGMLRDNGYREGYRNDRFEGNRDGTTDDR